MRSNSLIETDNLSKRFDRTLAVEGVSLSVRPGEILALLGPNGAGKTTTIRMLASILKPTSGTARVAGFDVVREAVDVRRHVGLLTEHHGLYARMRSHEYLEFFGRTYGLETSKVRGRAEELLNRYGLAEASGQRLGEFSKGMRQKLALVRCLLHDPTVLLLDEPTSAMDPASARQVRLGIQTLRSDDRAVLVSTHNLSEAEQLADQIAIIWRGQIRAWDTPPRLRRRYLGPPTMEVRTSRPIPAALDWLPAEARLVSRGRDWVRYTVDDPETSNPAVLRRLARARLPVLTLTEVGQNLEEVYLRVLEEAAHAIPEAA